MSLFKHLTTRIFLGLILGVVVGAYFHYYTHGAWAAQCLSVLSFLGQLFIDVIKVLVIPVVLFSLAAGVISLSSGKRLGRIVIKTFFLYLLTTVIAIVLGLVLASAFQLGKGSQMALDVSHHVTTPSLKENIVGIFFGNPLHAFTGKNMLQLIIIAIIVGIILRIKNPILEKCGHFVARTNHIMMIAVLWFMQLAPYGVFCLVSVFLAKTGFGLLGSLLGYVMTVLLASLIQWAGLYSLLLLILAKMNPLHFLKKMRQAIIFAFSVSSSNASIPIVLETCEEKIGIHNSVASFVIPLGATINMDGTAIMQGIATVFIANLYGVHLVFSHYVIIVISATLASIGAAGVPSMGLVTLAMVFQQVGIPVDGIAIILGVDRLLDMVRTAVNISGDATVASVVARSEDAIDQSIFLS